MIERLAPESGVTVRKQLYGQFKSGGDSASALAKGSPIIAAFTESHGHHRRD